MTHISERWPQPKSWIKTLLLNVTEGEAWTDGGWTRVGSYGSRINQARHNVMATVERSTKSNVHEQGIDLLVNDVGNAMKVEHCRCIVRSDHGRMCDRDSRKENERLNWEMEAID